MEKLLFFLVLVFSHCLFAQQSANYDESKVPDLVIPDLFVSFEGRRIKSIEDWEKIRRPEIIQAFADQMYGHLPKDYDQMAFEARFPANNPYGNLADYKIIELKVSRKGNSQIIPLHLFTPKLQKGPVPVVLLISHRAVDQLIADMEDQFFDIQQIVGRGYAAAVFDVEYVSPDDKERFADGILKTLYPEQMQMPNGMRGLGSWAWGAMRAMDYFEQDPMIDHTKAAVVGHSRGGKAALWCGANDSRWSVTYANESGCGGAALSRRKFGETVERINTVFPYWFTDNFDLYNGKEETLPFDQHQLIASLAPRTVYIASAMEDLWADPKGEYLSLKLASTTYSQIYGKQIELPEEYEFSPHFHHKGSVGYHLRSGKHDLTGEDWSKFLDFFEASLRLFPIF
ncbi:acetylxylan esterase [Shivajiella indica]|uniref:Acetylxylan esterase n=1 Tax=Shivajiella indica TaxID=872115 RepID=A0ABW5BEL5_9BACT